MLLYAILVYLGSSRNHGRPRVAVCPQLHSILSCVGRGGGGDYKLTQTTRNQSYKTEFLQEEGENLKIFLTSFYTIPSNFFLEFIILSS